MERFSVLIPDGESEFALFAMHGFMDKPNITLNVMANDSWVPPRFSRRCDKFFYRKIGSDPTQRLEAVAEVAQKTKADVLLPVGIDWIAFAGAHQEQLSQILSLAPVPTPESFKIVNDKWLLAQFMEKHQVAGPPTLLGSTDDDFARQLASFQFPILIKPVTAWGGEGIQRFETLGEFESFVEIYGLDKFKNRYIVQSFLPGYVVGLNVLCQNGKVLGHTMQRGIIPNSQKWAAAAAIKFIEQEGVLEVAQKLLTALNWSGFGNIDMFYDTSDQQVKILELNSRFWGSLRGSYVAGVSFPYLACLAALNIPFSTPPYKLTQYVHPKAAVKEGMSKLLRKSNHSFAFNETGLKYLFKDPLAEAVRALWQETAEDKWQ